MTALRTNQPLTTSEPTAGSVPTNFPCLTSESLIVMKVTLSVLRFLKPKAIEAGYRFSVYKHERVSNFANRLRLGLSLLLHKTTFVNHPKSSVFGRAA